MDFNYELRFPNAGYGDVLWDCKGEREILNHDSREQTFKQGQHMHYFLVGNGGANFRYYLTINLIGNYVRTETKTEMFTSETLRTME